jgi:hypothetical protein
MFKYEIPNPIETRRWQYIVRNDRICTFSRENIGDEFHYLFIYKHELIADLRSKFIHKMKGLLSLCNVPLLKNISLFISKLVGFSKLCFSCSHRNRFVINRQCNNIYCIIEFLYFAIVIPCSSCHVFHICTCNMTSCCTLSCV